LGERSSDKLGRPRAQALDRIGEMDLGDRVIAALDPDAMALHQHIGVGAARGRLEAIAREFDQEAERIGEVDRVHEAAVLGPAVPDPALVQACHRLLEGRARDGEREVVDRAGVGRSARRIGPARLVGEYRDQAPVAWIEVEMALRRLVQVRLLEHEGHAEHALPELDRGLAIGANQRDVMNALRLQFVHRRLPWARHSAAPRAMSSPDLI
jgi:hypothetical protein